jgi:hypothetical protein
LFIVFSLVDQIVLASGRGRALNRPDGQRVFWSSRAEAAHPAAVHPVNLPPDVAFVPQRAGFRGE